MRREQTSWRAALGLALMALALLACSSGGFAVATPAPIATNTPASHPLPVPTNNPPAPTGTPEGSGLVNGTATPAPTITPTATPNPLTPTATLASGATPTSIAVVCAVNGCPTPPPPTGFTPQPTPTYCPPHIFSSQTYTTAQITTAISDAATVNNIPVPLLEAEAWIESGWQWNVIACNGDTGLLQLSTATADWVNQQYGVNDNLMTLDGNAHLGAGFLANYYTYYISYLQQHNAAYCASQASGACDWDTVWPNATDHATVRDIVISIYNEGAGTMGKYGIVNWSYVIAVLSAFHDRYGGVGG